MYKQELMKINFCSCLCTKERTASVGICISLLFFVIRNVPFVWNVPCDDSRSMSHSFDSTELRDGTLMIEYTRHY